MNLTRIRYRPDRTEIATTPLEEHVVTHRFIKQIFETDRTIESITLNHHEGGITVISKE